MKLIALIPILFSCSLQAEQTFQVNLPDDAKALINEYHSDIKDLNSMKDIDLVDPDHGCNRNGWLPYGPHFYWGEVAYYYWPRYDFMFPNEWNQLQAAHTAIVHDTTDVALLETEKKQWEFAMSKDSAELRKSLDEQARILDKNYRDVQASLMKKYNDPLHTLSQKDIDDSLRGAREFHNIQMIQMWYESEQSFRRRYLINELKTLEALYNDKNYLAAGPAATAIHNQLPHITK